MRKVFKISLAVLAVAALIIMIKTLTSSSAQTNISSLSYYEKGYMAGHTLGHSIAFKVVLIMMAINGLLLTFIKEKKS